jgi:hypothetical protein
MAGSLLAGCSGDSGGDKDGTDGRDPRAGGSPSAGASASPSAGASGSGVLAADAVLPKTSADGRELADATVLAPGDWGRGFVAQSPAASTPGTWAVLGDDCRWRREKLPRGVLASASRYSRLPGGDGKGAVRVTAVVTVHDTPLGADDQVSTTLEEALRCPDQQTRGDERITGLMSVGTVFNGSTQNYADDYVLEDGKYLDGDGGTPGYQWHVARIGPVVVAVSVRGAKGRAQAELIQLGSDALVKMLQRVEQRVEDK